MNGNGFSAEQLPSSGREVYFQASDGQKRTLERLVGDGYRITGTKGGMGTIQVSQGTFVGAVTPQGELVRW